MEQFAIGVGVGVVLGGVAVYALAGRAVAEARKFYNVAEAFVQRVEAAARRVEKAAQL